MSDRDKEGGGRRQPEESCGICVRERQCVFLFICHTHALTLFFWEGGGVSLEAHVVAEDAAEMVHYWSMRIYRQSSNWGFLQSCS